MVTVRWYTRIGIALVSLLLVAAPAAAANTHFKRGSPTFIDQGETLTAHGVVAGVGNEDLLVTLTARGQPTGTCTNPAGQSEPPGQNPAEVEVTGTQAIPASEIKNGNAAFHVTTQPPASPVPGAPDCPNSQWTETITDVSFTTATLTFRQGGVVVLTTTCTFSPATSDRAVPSSTMSCS